VARFALRLTGDEDHDMFPWSVIDTVSGGTVNSFSHRAVADQVADRLNYGTFLPQSVEDVDEVEEHILHHELKREAARSINRQAGFPT
jgi:hypothetical protein